MKEYGYEISERGFPIAAGVVCKCPEPFCPAHGPDRSKIVCSCHIGVGDCWIHGKLDRIELRKGRRTRI